MTTNHIDQLAEWWENAEQGAARKGDTIIVRYDGDWEYGIRISDADMISHVSDIRILSRAPEPKPAWHDAVAVIAHTDDGHIRQVWERDGDTGYWCGTEGCLVATEKLTDVTPLIEAKVTDEMVKRARRHAAAQDATFIYSASKWHMREVITAALGLETA